MLCNYFMHIIKYNIIGGRSLIMQLDMMITMKLVCVDCVRPSQPPLYKTIDVYFHLNFQFGEKIPKMS